MLFVNNIHSCFPHPLQSKRVTFVVFAQNSPRKKNRTKSRNIRIVEDVESAPFLPEAPSPKLTEIEDERSVEEIYPVFAPPPSSIEKVKEGAWSWGESDAKEEEIVPTWNPQTGFMQTRAAQLEKEPKIQGDQASSIEQAPINPDFMVPSMDTPQLQFVTREQVLSSALGSAIWMSVLAFVMRAYAENYAPVLSGTDYDSLRRLLVLPQTLNWTDVGVMLATAGGVTFTRQQLLSLWPEFRAATHRSNTQILTPLNPFDIALVSLASGIPEELLFRGAIIPASFPDWRGAALSAGIFGALHVTGGRNAEFALWATGVGAVYGAAFLATGNIWVAAGAHTLSNFAAAVIWLKNNKAQDSNFLDL